MPAVFPDPLPGDEESCIGNRLRGTAVSIDVYLEDLYIVLAQRFSNYPTTQEHGRRTPCPTGPKAVPPGGEEQPGLPHHHQQCCSDDMKSLLSSRASDACTFRPLLRSNTGAAGGLACRADNQEPVHFRTQSGHDRSQYTHAEEQDTQRTPEPAGSHLRPAATMSSCKGDEERRYFFPSCARKCSGRAPT